MLKEKFGPCVDYERKVFMSVVRLCELIVRTSSGCGSKFLDRRLEARCREKTLEKSGLEPYDTKSPSRSEALRCS